MIKITVIKRDGTAHTVTADAKSSIMEAIRDNGIDELAALCGGSASCATCHVIVDPGFDMSLLPKMTPVENELLDSSDYRTSTSRLSCQLHCEPSLDGISVTIAPEE